MYSITVIFGVYLYRTIRNILAQGRILMENTDTAKAFSGRKTGVSALKKYRFSVHSSPGCPLLKAIG
jgi:hypothetical protein